MCLYVDEYYQKPRMAEVNLSKLQIPDSLDQSKIGNHAAPYYKVVTPSRDQRRLVTPYRLCRIKPGWSRVWTLDTSHPDHGSHLYAEKEAALLAAERFSMSCDVPHAAIEVQVEERSVIRVGISSLYLPERCERALLAEGVHHKCIAANTATVLQFYLDPDEYQRAYDQLIGETK